MAQEESFDLVVLGGGMSYVGAIRAAQRGLRVAVVEKDKVGGTCLHRGCIPTKALLHTADLLAEVRGRGAQLGFTGQEGLGVDLPRLWERKEKIVGQLHRGIQYLFQKYGVTLVQGEGRLLDPKTVAVGDRRLTGRYVLLATGSRPRALPGLPVDGKRILTSDEALAAPRVPRSVVVVGAGAVGVEWASLYRDLGAEVTVVEFLPRMVPQEDEEVSQELLRWFRRRGIQVLTGAQVVAERVEETPEGLRVPVRQGEQEITVEAEAVLVAVGRQAVVEGIGLENTRAVVDKGVVRVSPTQETDEPGVYAAGDMTGGYLLAHVAAHESLIAVDAMTGAEVEPLAAEKVPRCTYCRPQIASVGLSEAQAKERGHRVKTGRFPFRALGKALIVGEGEGFVKVVADADTQDLLGVHMIGVGVTDLIAEGTLAEYLEATAGEIGATVHAHPTLSEAVAEAAWAVDGMAIHI